MRGEDITEEIKNHKPGYVFGKGEGLYPQLRTERVKWVAIRISTGWTILYGKAYNTYESISDSNNCITDEGLIKQLVGCNQYTLRMYRNLKGK